MLFSIPRKNNVFVKCLKKIGQKLNTSHRVFLQLKLFCSFPTEKNVNLTEKDSIHTVYIPESLQADTPILKLNYNDRKFLNMITAIFLVWNSVKKIIIISNYIFKQLMIMVLNLVNVTNF